MKKIIILFLYVLLTNTSSLFSQRVIAGQVGPNMTYYDFPDDTLKADPAGHSAPT